MHRKAAFHNLGCKVNAYETEAMQQLLEDAGYEIVEAEVEQIPSMEANVTDESAIKSLTKLITSLEDNDDVQKVYFNCDLDLE